MFRRKLTSVARVASIVAIGCIAAACGGDDDSDGGSSGGAGGSSAGSGGQGGGGQGGASGGGSGGQGGSGQGGTGAKDNTAPQFAGVTDAQPSGDNAVRVSWDAATDNVSDAARIVYRVYSGVGGAVDYSRPIATSLPGATSISVGGLAIDTFTYAVRAVDEAGNEDDNVVTLDATTTDTTAPTFAGVTGATAVTSTSVLAQWKPATDNGDPSFKIRYRVFVSTTSDGHDFSNPDLETGPGATSATVTNVLADQELFVVVRAVDTSLNADSNLRVVSTMTPEGTPPTFAGAASATASGTEIALSWSPAADAVTASSEIVYYIYQATTQGGQNLVSPSFITDPGATSYTVSGLTPDTDYYFIVRARDLVGNIDNNVREVTAKTEGPDTTAPVFGGIESVTSDTPTTLALSWTAATDDRSAGSAIVYDVYVGSSAGVDTTTPALTTRPGQTDVLLTGLSPSTERFVVVRARDEAGNADGNGVEMSGTTLDNPSGDTTPPVLPGGLTATQVPSEPSWLLVGWAPATDDTYAAADIRYHVCVGADASACAGAAFFDNLYATSAFGASSVFVEGLVSRTDYVVYVRAEDKSGNVSTDDQFVAGTTATSFSTDLLPLIAARCNACHNYQYSTTVNVDSPYTDATEGLLKLVKPGDAVNSYLYRKVRAPGETGTPFSMTVPNVYDGDPMPSDGTGVIDPSDEVALRDWIEQGAFDN